MVSVTFLVHLAGSWGVGIAAQLQNSSSNKWNIKGEPSALSRVQKMQLLDRLPHLFLIPDARIRLFLTVDLQLFALIWRLPYKNAEYTLDVIQKVSNNP